MIRTLGKISIFTSKFSGHWKLNQFYFMTWTKFLLVQNFGIKTFHPNLWVCKRLMTKIPDIQVQSVIDEALWIRGSWFKQSLGCNGGRGQKSVYFGVIWYMDAPKIWRSTDIDVESLLICSMAMLKLGRCYAVVLFICFLCILHILLGLVSICLGVGLSVRADIWTAHTVSPIWSGACVSCFNPWVACRS